MRRRIWALGAAATCAVVFALGASRSGEHVQFDTVSDILATKFNAYATGTSSVVFDESTVHTYDLQVAPADWEWLGENPLLEQYVPATLKFHGRTYEDVGIRYKGSFGALRFCFDATGKQTCERLSFKLRFNEYDSSGRFYGLRRLNLHSMNSDPTKVRDALGYGLFRDAGVPAPRTAYARLLVNGELLGLFVVVEEIDEEFITHAFPDAGKGTLYQEVWPEHATVEPYAAAIVAGSEEDAGTMLGFAQSLQSAEDGDFVSVLDAWTDLDTFMKYLAVDRLIDNWDGIVAWYCPPAQACFNHNYFWYQEAFSGRMWLIPWDLDNTFRTPSPIRTAYGMPDWDAAPSCGTIRVFRGIPARPPACDPFISRLASLAWEDYAAATRELLDGPFAVQRLHARIDRLSALITPAVAEDPNRQTLAEWEAAVTKLKADILPMRGYVEAKLEN